jgi:hypothetical protein
VDPEKIQTIAARDQLWSSLRALLPEIDDIAAGRLDGSDRQRQIVQIIARVVSAELGYRAGQSGGEEKSEPSE